MPFTTGRTTKRAWTRGDVVWTLVTAMFLVALGIASYMVWDVYGPDYDPGPVTPTPAGASSTDPVEFEYPDY